MDDALHRMMLGSSGQAKPASPAKVSKKGSATRRGRKRLLNRESLDGRTITAKVWDQRAAAIYADMAGRDQLSAIELGFVEAFVGASVVLDHLNTKILAGAEIDNALVSAHAATVSALVRVGSRLGLQRRAKNVTPTVKQYLEHINEREEEPAE